MSPLALVAFAVLGALDFVRIPMEPDESVLMLLAPAEKNHHYAVLTSHLHLHTADDSDTTRRLEAPTPSGVYDIEPPDAAGVLNVIAVEGRAVTRYRFREVGQATRPEVLFELDEPYPTAGTSELRSLLVTLDGGKLLALPGATEVKLYDFSGRLVRTIPASDTLEPPLMINRHFEVDREKRTWTVTVEPPARMGWLLPESLQAAGLGGLHGRPSSSMRTAYVQGEVALIIRADVDHLTFAVPVAVGQPDGKTVLRYRSARSMGADNFDDVRDQSPALSFPGYLLSMEGRLPDFNGDGYGDLALWSFSEPVGSPEALLRALSSDAWPAKCSIHLFNPGRNRHEAKPSARLDVQSRLMNRLPGEMTLAHDVNGDGCSDLAMSLSSDSFSIWLWRKGRGFDAKPDVVVRLSEPLERIERSLPMRDGGTAVGLRAAGALYVPTQRPAS